MSVSAWHCEDTQSGGAEGTGSPKAGSEGIVVERRGGNERTKQRRRFVRSVLLLARSLVRSFRSFRSFACPFCSLPPLPLAPNGALEGTIRPSVMVGKDEECAAAAAAAAAVFGSPTNRAGMKSALRPWSLTVCLSANVVASYRIRTYIAGGDDDSEGEADHIDDEVCVCCHNLPACSDFVPVSVQSRIGCLSPLALTSSW